MCYIIIKEREQNIRNNIKEEQTMKQTIKTKEAIAIAKDFANKSKQYKEEGKKDSSYYYQTLAFGIESALRVLAFDIDISTAEQWNKLNNDIWGE